MLSSWLVPLSGIVLCCTGCTAHSVDNRHPFMVADSETIFVTTNRFKIYDDVPIGLKLWVLKGGRLGVDQGPITNEMLIDNLKRWNSGHRWNRSEQMPVMALLVPTFDITTAEIIQAVETLKSACHAPEVGLPIDQRVMVVLPHRLEDGRFARPSFPFEIVRRREEVK